MKTTIKNWLGDSSIELELLPASSGESLASISQASGSLSFFFAMDEAGLSQLICDAINIRNLMRVQPKIILADDLNKGKS